MQRTNAGPYPFACKGPRPYFKAIVLLFFLLPLHAADQEPTIQGHQTLPVEQSRKHTPLALTPEEQVWLAEHQSIVFGAARDLPPLNFFNEKGHYQGYNVDLVEELNRILGFNIRILPGEWAQLQEKVRKSELDGLLGLSLTEERKHYLVFTEPYLNIPSVLFTRKDFPPVNQLHDFDGRTVAIHEGSSSIVFFWENFPDIQVIPTKSHLAALLSVSLGEIDAAYMGLGAGSYYASTNAIANLKAATIVHGGDNDVRLGVRKDWPQLASILQKALDSLSPEQWKSLSRHWTDSFSALEPVRLSLTQQEEKWLEGHPVVRVVMDPYQAPVEFRDEDGQFRGISQEYLGRLEELLGIHFEVADVPSWTEGLEEVRNKRLDMVSSIATSEERKQSLLFTSALNSMPVTIFARNDISFIGSLDNLSGKTVAVTEDSPVAGWMQRDYPQLKLFPVPNIRAGLRVLSDGDVDVFVDNLVYTSYYMGKAGVNNVRIAGETPYTHYQTMAVRNDWPVFATILQKALNAIDQQEREAFYNRWMSIRFEVEADYTIFWLASTLSALLLAIFFYWNRRLSREVATRRRTEMALQAAKAAAEVANQAKSAFLANMSHEIRTPMNAIVGLTYLLQQSDPTPEQKSSLEQLDSSANHLLSIINNILDLSKIESGKLDLEQSEFRLDEIFDSVQAVFEEQAGSKSLSFEVALDEVPHWLRGDPTRLRQALLNYVGNAIKFSERGTISLRAKKLAEDGDDILVRFEVRDTGIGIEPDTLSKLFMAFEQADASTTRKYGGTGLGLVITRRLAELMGGEAGATSEPGQGSTFWFTARLGRGHGSQPTAATTAAADTGQKLRSHGRGLRVLLVEDNDMNRKVALAVLATADLAVETAENGREAVEKVRTNTYDLILMDVQMPVMSGPEAARIIRSMTGKEDIPILAMTAAVFEEDRVACLEAGMNDSITKPIDVKAMLATIARWLPEMETVNPV